MIFKGVVALAALSAVPVMAADKVQYGKVPAWVMPPPSPTDTPAPAGAAARIIYSDVQTRLTDRGDEVYTAYRIKLLTADALAAGNIATSWNPDAGSVTVHHLRIIRDGKVINVLSKSRFMVIRQEAQLEAAMLHGMLTATLQTPGLRIGDELEFAATILGRDPTLGDHHFGFSALPPQGNPGPFRVRLSWPQEKTVRWRATPDLGQMVPHPEGGQMVLQQELRDPKAVVPTEGAPPRFNLRRLIEYSDYTDWQDISATMASFFDRAAALKDGSPVRREAATIASRTSDPVERAKAALILVQDQLRYVYVGLNGGNFRPANADESWARRFGDCKAKTAMLLALLRELGVQAEAVLVQSAGGDGLDQRLPNPLLFDHVLVRATIAGKIYWLDGTRLGDRSLNLIPPPLFRWVLPLRSPGAGLEAVVPRAPREPQLIAVLDIDARAGIEKPGKVKLDHILRGDGVYALRTTLSSLSKDEADRQLQSYWRNQANWVDATKVQWRYEEDKAALVLSLIGEGRLDWDGNTSDGWSHYLNGAGFYAPSALKRPAEQDQDAPYAIGFPRFRCYATILRLPPLQKGHWNIVGRRMNRSLGGVAYWRGLSIRDNIVRSVMSSRSIEPEISARQAAVLNAQINRFDDKMTRIDQDFTLAADVGKDEPMLAKGDAIDWLSSATPCDGPGDPSGVPMGL
ncbi:DUF3857 domain-containing protein [Sphingobium abikonense]|uniref:DUF3857 domain-containing protein n=1 Tax=Sphingobium abikonense TaxID=86193 RepID=UPI003512C809